MLSNLQAFKQDLLRFPLKEARVSTDQLKAKKLFEVEGQDRLCFDANVDSIERLSLQFQLAHKSISRQAHDNSIKLKQQWPGDPRFCTRSLFGPIGQRWKELPLTRALAWLLNPRQESKLHAHCLSTCLSLILGKKVDASEVADWNVRAEEPLQRKGSMDGGRIDIFAEGQLAGSNYAIAIEAKVNAVEGVEQVEKYASDLRSRATEFSKERQDQSCGRSFETVVCFLTPSGSASNSCANAHSISYKTLLEDALFCALKAHPMDIDFAFCQMLLADIARDLADTHLLNESAFKIASAREVAAQ